MADDNDFNERIRRIQQARGLPPGGGAPHARGGAGGTVARLPQTFLHLGLVAILVAGGAYAYQRTQADAAALQAVGLSPGEGDQRGFLTRMVADYLLPYPTGTPTWGDPVMLLPPAPAGWIRVTEIDAQADDPMAEIGARWATLGGSLSLDQSPGHATLLQFLDRNRSTDLESRALAERRSSALYLDGVGNFVVVGLSFRGSRQTLGEPGDARGWHARLADEERSALLSGDVLEEIDLDGFRALNRAPGAGKSLIARPIGKDLDAPNTLRLAVPVAPRAVMRIEGMATPRLAADLLATVELDRVAAASAE